MQLTVALRQDINEFGKRVSEAAESQNTVKSSSAAQTRDITSVLDSMKDLLRRIEDVLSALIGLSLGCSAYFISFNDVGG